MRIFSFCLRLMYIMNRFCSEFLQKIHIRFQTIVSTTKIIFLKRNFYIKDFFFRLKKNLRKHVLNTQIKI